MCCLILTSDPDICKHFRDSSMQLTLSNEMWHTSLSQWNMTMFSYRSVCFPEESVTIASQSGRDMPICFDWDVVFYTIWRGVCDCTRRTLLLCRSECVVNLWGCCLIKVKTHPTTHLLFQISFRLAAFTYVLVVFKLILLITSKSLSGGKQGQ